MKFMLRLFILLLTILNLHGFASANKTDKAILKCFVQYIQQRKLNDIRAKNLITSVSYDHVRVNSIAISTGKKKGFLYWSNQKSYGKEAISSNPEKLKCCVLFIDEKGNLMSYLITGSKDKYSIYELLRSGRYKLKETMCRNT